MPMPRLRLSSQPTIITSADRARSAGEWQLAAGLYRIGKSLLYVNVGAGTTGPPVRLGARAELTLLVLKKSA